MNSRILTWMIPVMLFAVLALPIQLAAQGHHRYKLVDLGTLGGPNSGQLAPGQSLNDSGTVITAESDLPVPDPYAPNCLQDCFLSHAMKWEKGVSTDLGALPRVNDSIPLWISANGLIAGASENGLIDPLTGFPQLAAVLWKKDGSIVTLGGFGGNPSQALSINDHGQAVGVALNTIPDPFAQYMYGPPAATQARAFLWQNGAMQDLGTLGGPDAAAFVVNERGHILGLSFTNSLPNPATGIPTVHPFLWENGHMLDIGSLGGTIAVQGAICCGGVGLNNRDQVSGTSTLAGDQVRHPFLWERGVLRDLGTLGGVNAEAFYISASGEVVGQSEFSPSSTNHHAFSWRDGMMKDLGTLGTWPCSGAGGANSKGQVVGNHEGCGGQGPPFLVENGEPMVDLTKLLLPGSVTFTAAAVAFINERGEIAGQVVLPNGDYHAILLIPCDRDHGNVEGCEGHVDEIVTDDMLMRTQTDPAPNFQTTRAVDHVSPMPSPNLSRFHRNIHD